MKIKFTKEEEKVIMFQQERIAKVSARKMYNINKRRSLILIKLIIGCFITISLLSLLSNNNHDEKKVNSLFAECGASKKFLSGFLIGIILGK